MKLVHVLKSAVSIGGQKEVMRLVVFEREGGSMFYDHAIDREEMAALGRNAGALDSADAADLDLPALHHEEPSSWQRREENVDDDSSGVNLDGVYNQFDPGTKVFDAEGRNYTVSRQDGLRVYVKEKPGAWFHPNTFACRAARSRA